MRPMLLGEVTKRLDESVVLLEDLAALAPDDTAPALRRLAAGRRALLAELADLERAAGRLPAAGEPEHAHLRALGAALRGRLSGGHERSVLHERLAAADRELADAIADARRDGETPLVVRPCLERLEAHLGETDRRLGDAARSDPG